MKALRSRAVAAVLVLLPIGACTVTTSPERADQGRETLERFRETGTVEWDLTEPRSPQDLGVPEGRSSAIFDRGAGDPFWTARLTLPGPATFTTDRVIAVAVDVPSLPGGLALVGVQAVAEGEAEVVAQLRRDVEQLGLDPRQVADVPRPGSSRVLDGRAFGYLRTSVEVRVPEDAGRTTLNYSFVWDGTASPTPAG